MSGIGTMRYRRKSSAFTLVETVIAVTVLSLAVPGMFWALRDAESKRVEPVMGSRARWFAAEKIEDVLADRNSALRGYGYVVNANYADESSVASFPGFSRSVSITEKSFDLASTGTGYKVVTVTVGYLDGTGSAKSLAVSTVVTEYTP